MHGETLAVISRKITLRRQVRNVGDILARGHIRTRRRRSQSYHILKITSFAIPCPWLFCAFGTLSHRSGKNYILSQETEASREYKSVSNRPESRPFSVRANSSAKEVKGVKGVIKRIKFIYQTWYNLQR